MLQKVMLRELKEGQEFRIRMKEPKYTVIGRRGDNYLARDKYGTTISFNSSQEVWRDWGSISLIPVVPNLEQDPYKYERDYEEEVVA